MHWFFFYKRWVRIINFFSLPGLISTYFGFKQDIMLTMSLQNVNVLIIMALWNSLEFINKYTDWFCGITDFRVGCVDDRKKNLLDSREILKFIGQSNSKFTCPWFDLMFIAFWAFILVMNYLQYVHDNA